MTVDFRFYTRTLSEDYRVFADNGAEPLNYAEEFEPFTVMAEVESDDERSAAVFADGGEICVAAFGLSRGAKDRARRDIRFSFCVLLPGSEWGAAMRIFSRVKDEWDETGKKAGELIKEIPTTRQDWKGRDVKGEDVRFDYVGFLKWLTAKPANADIKPPRAGYMRKYFADTWKIEHKPVGGQDGNDDEDVPGLRRMSYEPPKRGKSPGIWLAVSGVLLVICGILGWKLHTVSQELSKTQDTLLKTQPSEEDYKRRLESANTEISGLKNTLAITQRSLDIYIASQDKRHPKSQDVTTNNKG